MKRDDLSHEVRPARLHMLLRIALITSLTALAACSFKKPPECASPEVLKVLKSVVTENAQQSFLGKPAEDDSRQMRLPSAFFYRNVELAISSVSDKGVNNQKIRSCSAVMKLNLPTSASRLALVAQLKGVNVSEIDVTSDGGVKQKIEYEILSDEQGEQFEVESHSLNSIIEIVSLGHASLASKLTWAGTWTGSYRCEPIATPRDWAAEYSSSHTSFELPIEKFNASGSYLALERKTNKGGTEKINISLGPGAEANVRIDGANTPRDRWEGYMRGNVRDEKLSLTGTLKMIDRSEVANCSVNLDFTPISEQLIAESLNEPN